MSQKPSKSALKNFVRKMAWFLCSRRIFMRSRKVCPPSLSHFISRILRETLFILVFSSLTFFFSYFLCNSMLQVSCWMQYCLCQNAISFSSFEMSNVTIFCVYGVSVRIFSKASITSGDWSCNSCSTSSSEIKKFYKLKYSQ